MSDTGFQRSEHAVHASLDTIRDRARKVEEKPEEKQPVAPITSKDDFTGPPQQVQLRLPSDLVTALKLHSFQSGKTMSEIVFNALTTPEIVAKAWVATRRSA